MIYGVGTDIVSVERLSQLWEKHGEHALKRLLAEEELAEFSLASDKGRFLAKRFAAKEALGKALGTGIRAPALMTAMAVLHDVLGKPEFICRGGLAEMVKNQKLKIHLSISDEQTHAVAFVVVEQA